MGNLMSKKEEENEENETTAWGINQKDQEATQWASRGEVLGNMATRKYDNTNDKPPKQYSRKKTGDRSLKKDEEQRTRSTTRTGERQIGSRSGTLERRSGSAAGTGERRNRSSSRTRELQTRSSSKAGESRTRSSSRAGESRTRSTTGTLEWRTGSRSGTLEQRTGSRTGTLERGTGSTSGTGSVRSASNVSGSGPIYPWKQEASLDTRIDCRGRKIKSQTVAANIEHKETSQEVYELGHSKWRSDESDEGTPTYEEQYKSKSVYSDKQMAKHSPATKTPESRRHQLYFGQQEYYVGY